MSVAFPVGVGLALVLGVLINYFGAAKGDPLFIFLGVALIAAAIVMNGLAYRMARTGKRKLTAKGLLISVAAGTIMAFSTGLSPLRWTSTVSRPPQPER